MSIQVFDNYLPIHTFQEIKDYYTSEIFPWFFGNAVKENSTDTNNDYNWQLYHMLYHTPNMISDHNTVLLPLYDKLNFGVLVKSKVNCNHITNNIIEHGMHNDIEVGNLVDVVTTAVYYLNTNNGYTKFEDGTIVESVENRLVTFPASTKHTGSTCTDQKCRIVFNINYIEKTRA